MNQPVFTSPMPVSIDVQQLIDDIVKTFTPMAFQCSCNGTDPSCRKVIESDRWAMAQADTTRRIAEFVRLFAAGRSLSVGIAQVDNANALDEPTQIVGDSVDTLLDGEQA